MGFQPARDRPTCVLRPGRRFDGSRAGEFSPPHSQPEDRRGRHPSAQPLLRTGWSNNFLANSFNLVVQVSLAVDPTSSSLPISPIFIKTGGGGGGVQGVDEGGEEGNLVTYDLLDNFEELPNIPTELLSLGNNQHFCNKIVNFNKLCIQCKISSHYTLVRNP